MVLWSWHLSPPSKKILDSPLVVCTTVQSPLTICRWLIWVHEMGCPVTHLEFKLTIVQEISFGRHLLVLIVLFVHFLASNMTERTVPDDIPISIVILAASGVDSASRKPQEGSPLASPSPCACTNNPFRGILHWAINPLCKRYKSHTRSYPSLSFIFLSVQWVHAV